MQCQYLYDCDPGESHARPCPDKATARAELTYRHGEEKSSVPMCDYHAKLRTDNLNLWGAPYGHSAQVLALTPAVSQALLSMAVDAPRGRTNSQTQRTVSIMTKRTVGFTGTVSRATMRPEDLIPAFMRVLEEYWPEKAAKLAGYYGGECGWPYATCGLLFPDPIPDHLKEASGFLLQDLCDALGEIAPQDHYFGSTPGDGCNYGFWQDPFDDADSW